MHRSTHQILLVTRRLVTANEKYFYNAILAVLLIFLKIVFFAGVRGEESCLGLSDLGFFHTACLTFYPCVSTEIKQHKSFRNKRQDDRAGGRLLEKTPFQQASERHHKRGTGSGSAHSTQGAAEAGARSGRTGSSPGCAVIKSCCP